MILAASAAVKFTRTDETVGACKYATNLSFAP